MELFRAIVFAVAIALSLQLIGKIIKATSPNNEEEDE